MDARMYEAVSMQPDKRAWIINHLSIFPKIEYVWFLVLITENITITIMKLVNAKVEIMARK